MKKFLILFLTILFFTVGNVLFAIPNIIMNGGITGLSQIAYYLLALFLFNLPLFILSFLFYRKLFYNSVLSMITVSLLIGVLQDPLLP